MFQTSVLVMSSSAALTESPNSAAAAVSSCSWLEAAEPGGESQVKLLPEILRPKLLLMMGMAARRSSCCAKLLNGQLLTRRVRVARVKLSGNWLK